MNRTSQTNAILEHLKKGESITSMDALNMFKCFRLAARIYDLRKNGWEIEETLIKSETGNRYAEYKLKKEEKQLAD